MILKKRKFILTTAYNQFKDKWNRDGRKFDWSLADELSLWNKGDRMSRRTRHSKNGLVRTIVDYSKPVAAGNVAIMTREQSKWNFRKQTVDRDETRRRKSEAAKKRWNKRQLKARR